MVQLTFYFMIKVEAIFGEMIEKIWLQQTLSPEEYLFMLNLCRSVVESVKILYLEKMFQFQENLKSRELLLIFLMYAHLFRKILIFQSPNYSRVNQANDSSFILHEYISEKDNMTSLSYQRSNFLLYQPCPQNQFLSQLLDEFLNLVFVYVETQYELRNTDLCLQAFLLLDHLQFLFPAERQLILNRAFEFYIKMDKDQGKKIDNEEEWQSFKWEIMELVNRIIAKICFYSPSILNLNIQTVFESVAKFISNSLAGSSDRQIDYKYMCFVLLVCHQYLKQKEEHQSLVDMLRELSFKNNIDDLEMKIGGLLKQMETMCVENISKGKFFDEDFLFLYLPEPEHEDLRNMILQSKLLSEMNQNELTEEDYASFKSRMTQ